MCLSAICAHIFQQTVKVNVSVATSFRSSRQTVATMSHKRPYQKDTAGFYARACDRPRAPMKKGRAQPRDRVRDPLNRSCPYG